MDNYGRMMDDQRRRMMDDQRMRMMDEQRRRMMNDRRYDEGRDRFDFRRNPYDPMGFQDCVMRCARRY